MTADPLAGLPMPVDGLPMPVDGLPMPVAGLPMPLAGLPMYDWPEVSADWDALWALWRDLLRAQGVAAPDRLARPADPFALWRDPALLAGQTCGWPFVSMLSDRLVPFARFDFGEAVRGGGRPGDYHSVLVAGRNARARDAVSLLRGAGRIAVNALDSQSGWRALGSALDAPFTLPRERLLLTGSHRASARAVAAGDAVLAALDAQSWQLALRFEAEAAAALTVLACTAPVPGLPLVAAREHAHHAPLLLATLQRAVERSDPALLARLGCVGVVPAAGGDYGVLTRLPFGQLALAGAA